MSQKYEEFIQVLSINSPTGEMQVINLQALVQFQVPRNRRTVKESLNVKFSISRLCCELK